jgi:hypothetical protein
VIPAPKQYEPVPAPSGLGAMAIKTAESRVDTFFRVCTPAFSALFDRLGLKFKGGKQWWSQRNADMHVSIHIAIPVEHLITEEQWSQFMTKLVKTLQKAKENQEVKPPKPFGDFPLM